MRDVGGFAEDLGGCAGVTEGEGAGPDDPAGLEGAAGWEAVGWGAPGLDPAGLDSAGWEGAGWEPAG